MNKYNEMSIENMNYCKIIKHTNVCLCNVLSELRGDIGNK